MTQDHTREQTQTQTQATPASAPPPRGERCWEDRDWRAARLESRDDAELMLLMGAVGPVIPVYSIYDQR